MSTPDLYVLLHEDAAVEALVGERIFPSLQKGRVYPSVVYYLVSTFRDRTYCGDTRLASGSFQLDVYARQYSEMVSTADAVRERMLDFTGVVAGTRIRQCTLTTEYDSVDSDPGLFRRTQQWDIWYEDRS
jgi:hypothetical protein